MAIEWCCFSIDAREKARTVSFVLVIERLERQIEVTPRERKNTLVKTKKTDAIWRWILNGRDAVFIQ